MTQLKYFILVVIILSLSTHVAWSASYVEQLIEKSKAHEKITSEEGLGYMIGGGLALTTSVAQSIRQTEILPKAGYSIIQVLSIFAISHGAELFFVGDDFTAEIERIKDYSAALKKIFKISTTERYYILNNEIKSTIDRYYNKRRKLKKIRGTLGFISAASSLSVLVFSKQRTITTNMTLGFLSAMGLASGTYEFLTINSKDESYQLNFAFLPTPKATAFAIQLRY